MLAVLGSVTLDDRRPADQRALMGLQLQQAHDTITEATWGGGGMQSWGWAVDQLATAVAHIQYGYLVEGDLVEEVNVYAPSAGSWEVFSLESCEGPSMP